MLRIGCGVACAMYRLSDCASGATICWAFGTSPRREWWTPQLPKQGERAPADAAIDQGEAHLAAPAFTGHEVQQRRAVRRHGDTSAEHRHGGQTGESPERPGKQVIGNHAPAMIATVPVALGEKATRASDRIPAGEHVTVVRYEPVKLTGQLTTQIRQRIDLCRGTDD